MALMSCFLPLRSKTPCCWLLQVFSCDGWLTGCSGSLWAVRLWHRNKEKKLEMEFEMYLGRWHSGFVPAVHVWVLRVTHWPYLCFSACYCIVNEEMEGAYVKGGLSSGLRCWVHITMVEFSRP